MLLDDLFLAALPRAWSTYLVNFQYSPGSVPLSSLPVPIIVTFAFLVALGLGKAFMRDRQPFELKWLLAGHNLLLSVVSGVSLLLLHCRVWPRLMEHGWHYVLCDWEMYNDGLLQFLYYVNMLLKYYELLDTLFLVLRKKETNKLHIYHHIATMWLAWIQLYDTTSMQWLPIWINLLVHVFMYYYYFVCALGSTVWWKRYLTTMQIIQFVLDLVACYYATYFFYSAGTRVCRTGNIAVISGDFVITSYLFLFIHLYVYLYLLSGGNRKRREKGADAAASSDAAGKQLANAQQKQTKKKQ